MDEKDYIILDSKKMSIYDIDNVCEILESGKIVVFPTETVYGVACNALNMKSVKRLYDIKRRDYSKPLLLHIGNVGDVYKYIKKVDKRVKKLIEKYWPGPLSLILEKNEVIPDYVTNGSDKLGIRCTSHRTTQLILNRCKVPIVATSANISGHENCYNIEQISKQFGSMVDIYIDDGDLSNNVASTIIELEDDDINVIREGVVKSEEIFSFLKEEN